MPTKTSEDILMADMLLTGRDKYLEYITSPDPRIIAFEKLLSKEMRFSGTEIRIIRHDDDILITMYRMPDPPREGKDMELIYISEPIPVEDFIETLCLGDFMIP